MNHHNQSNYPIHFKANLLAENLDFYTTFGIFSPKTIDKGTLLLLHYLDCKDAINVLDLGCGYGPIGLAVAKKYPQTQVDLVDKDFIAVDAVNFNAKKNAISNAKGFLSNGLSACTKNYDRIYCNLPAKIGNELTYIFLNQCKEKLNEGGLMQWVCINSLRLFMKRAGNEIFGNFKKIKQSSQYTVFEIQQLGKKS